MTDDDEPHRRPVEANLAQALCWGAPAWILDDGPPPVTTRRPRRALRRRAIALLEQWRRRR